MPDRLLGYAALLTLSLLFSAAAVAQYDKGIVTGGTQCGADQRVRFRGVTARLENDLFAGSDQNYSSGIAIAMVSHDLAGRLKPECLPTAVRLHAELIKRLDPGYWSDADNVAHSQNVVVKFGQSIYTPRDRARTDLILNDRPYAGLLYIGMAWNLRKHDPESGSENLDTRELTLGVIGPWARAEEMQNAVHAAIGEDEFLGWRHQLKNEPALQVAMERKFKDYHGIGLITPGFSADSIRSLGLRLGNIESSAALGIEGRIGWNLPNDFGTYPIRPGSENRPPSAARLANPANAEHAWKETMRSGIHLFGMLETKFVAHDFSLDGNLIRASHGVTRRPWLAQAAIGLSSHGSIAGREVKLAVMHVFRSREFDEQEHRPAYGSIALSMGF